MKYVLCLIVSLCLVSVSAAAPDQSKKAPNQVKSKATCSCSCAKTKVVAPDQVKKVVVKTADQVKVKKFVYPTKAPEPSIKQPRLRKFLNKFRREFV